MIPSESDRVSACLAASLARLGQAPESLLQHLIALQQELSWIPPSAVASLSEVLVLSRAEIRATVAFYAFLHDRPRGAFDILFSDNITDRMLGSQRLQRLLGERLGVAPGETRSDGRVTLDRTSCTGMGDQGPALLVNGWAITRLTAARIDRIADLVEDHRPLAQWPEDFFQVRDHIRRPGLLLSNPVTRGGSLEILRDRGPEAALTELERSGLRGRGGAGFPTARKWRYARLSPGETRYVVCNADEGEPGTFKDRVLLHAYADLVFEGMTLCAGILGATRGLLYLRGEYRYLLSRLEGVLARRRAEGRLGRSILGEPGFDFDIAIHLGAGAYICGEESALLESLEGRRGLVRRRPPFPVAAGYLGQPTVVNNVETFLAAARIVEWGGYRFRCEGTEQSAGSKILSVSGDVARPGIYEYPFGTPVYQILRDCGADPAQAVQVSGAAGHTLAPAEFDRLLAFEDLPTSGAFMVFGQSRDLLEMVRNFTDFFAHESCGFCTPCRVGCRLAAALVAKIAAGRASLHDLNELRQIGDILSQASYCGLGQSASHVLFDTLDKFPEIYHRRVQTREATPAFDLEAALAEARTLTGRDDAGAHLEEEA